MGHEYIEVLGTGTKTYETLFSELHAKIDWTKFATPNTRCALTLGTTVMNMETADAGNRIITFRACTANSSAGFVSRIVIQQNSANCWYHTVRMNVGGTIQFVNDSVAKPGSGTSLRIYYN